MKNEIITIGLIGLGRMGQNHLRVLSMLKNVEVIFIFDTDLQKAMNIGITHNVVVAEDIELFLGKVDAVIISSPTFTHANYLRQVAKYVKNIFVEKPIADTLSEAKSVWNLCQEKALNVQVGFIERYNPAIQSYSGAEPIKKIVSIDFSRTNKISSRITDVDVITDLMIHDIDLALHLNGPVKFISVRFFKSNDRLCLATGHTTGNFSRIQASRITEKKTRSIQATCVDMFVDCDLCEKK